MTSCWDGLCSYVVNTDLDGKLSQTGLFDSSDEQLDAIIDELISFFKKTPNQPNRLLFYGHGGMVSETSAKQNAILHQYRTFLWFPKNRRSRSSMIPSNCNAAPRRMAVSAKRTAR
ncbi:MAG: hypothetical protein WCC10_03615 [Tumebacillaceae bacterium]